MVAWGPETSKLLTLTSQRDTRYGVLSPNMPPWQWLTLGDVSTGRTLWERPGHWAAHTLWQVNEFLES
jgi:hypothetical protein